MGANRKKRKNSKGSPENNDSEKKRANVMTTQSPQTDGPMQNASGQQNVGNVANSYLQNQNGQCFTPGPMINQNQNFPPPVYNYTHMLGQTNQTSPSLTHAYLQPTPGIAASDQFSALIQRLDNIDTKLNRLEGIQTAVNKITVRLEQVDQRVSGIESKIKDIEKSQEFDSQSLEEIKKKQKEIDSFKTRVSELEDQQKKANVEIRRDLTDIKGRSMRDNLLFFGIPEVTDREDRETDANCVDKVLDVIETKMKIEGAKQNIKLHRAHRIGRYNPQKTRPIVAKFAYYPDRESVRTNANTLVRPFGVSQQFPPEVMYTRKRLIPIMLEARGQGKEAYISGDKLFINGNLYREPGAAAGR